MSTFRLKCCGRPLSSIIPHPCSVHKGKGLLPRGGKEGALESSLLCGQWNQSPAGHSASCWALLIEVTCGLMYSVILNWDTNRVFSRLKQRTSSYTVESINVYASLHSKIAVSGVQWCGSEQGHSKPEESGFFRRGYRVESPKLPKATEKSAVSPGLIFATSVSVI